MVLTVVGKKTQEKCGVEGKKTKPTAPLRSKNKNKTRSRTQYTDVVQIISAPGSALASLTHRKPPRGKEPERKK